MQGKKNQIINSEESATYQREIELKEFTIILKRAILDWEDKMREQSKYFDGFDELSILVGLHPQTIRKFTNSMNPEFPKLNQLLAICNSIGDFKPIEYFYDFANLIRNNK